MIDNVMRFLFLLLILVAGCGAPMDVGPEISRDELLLEHNKQRAMNGLESLKMSPVLEERAQKWAVQMASRGRLYHSSLDLKGTGFWTMGENIAVGYTNEESVVKGWMESTGHRRNILNKGYTEAGFGFARKGSGYWCVQFGGRQ